MMMYLVLFITVFVFSWLGVGAFVRWGKRRLILDVPNERSSHENPTPVGGGVVIVILSLLAFVGFELVTGNGLRFWPYFIGGASIAAVSWVDDIRKLPALLRFGVHTAAAVLAVWGIGGFESIGFYPGPYSISVGASTGSVLTVLWIVWLTNAYNFMDGIDGLAGSQGVIAAACWALIGWNAGIDSVLFFSVALIAACLGFLVHNWPPARVFMGDVGSAFLGYTFAVLPLLTLKLSNSIQLSLFLPIAAVAVVWVFVNDTLMTFVARMYSGDRVWEPHRKHAYQRLVRGGMSHIRVTLFYSSLMFAAGAAVTFERFLSINGLTILVCLVLAIVLGGATLFKKVDGGEDN